METIKDKGVAEKSTAEHNGSNGSEPSGENPLARVIGGFADDPLWNEFIEEMEQSRRELDQKHRLVE